ncbi:hypothetical protein BCE75_106121 [Isoptericola sp. CG 20/1183]|uniref:Uncharacterized protein n=1 Tax=Isoptericola halotolerans TaxID=300560 RepID=A0ABX5EDJ2_9MICO|nr:hypothetical protein BCL65_106113 [Isoptericola halotolerans]PRZ06755.1 hypothetical protein BCE75_106121 [Isoptericola sp. CG 20/1183]
MAVDGFWDFLGSYWWLVFPLSGIVGGWAKGAQKWDERRRRDKIELYRLKHADQLATAQAEEALTSEIERTTAEHDRTNERWLEYELDAVKSLEFPVMTDMREQVTVDFHRARRDADSLRPDDPEELRDRRRLERYRAAVREYQLTFDIAEREAKRRLASDFTADERRALDRAKKLLALADDPGASHAERQSAYRRATKELEGILVLPDAATDAIEQRIAGMLGPASGRDAAT